MYTLYNNLRFTGHDQVHTWQQGTYSWAAYSVYRQKASHEVYTPRTILNLIVKGHKRMYDGRVVHHLQAGDVFLIPAGSLICSEILARQEGYESINVELPEEQIATYTSVATSGLHIGAVKLPPTPVWQQFTKKLLYHFTQPHIAPSRTTITTQALSLIADMPAGAAVMGMLQQASHNAFPELMQTLGQELPHLHQLDEIARSTCMSKATLKRRFRQLYHTAPMTWIWEKRLEQAAFLLRTTPATISEIAYRAGFENISHFYRLFRKSYGITPKDWRDHVFSI